MKVILTTTAALALSTTLAMAGSSKTPPGQLDTNWGELTSGAIKNGFKQGPHASDPSGDGHGPGTADEPRAGLANVVNKGDMAATTELIDSLLNP